jgi:hypothetical protein
MEGYGNVTALAEFLLQLETCSSLTNGQAQQVIELWSKLSRRGDIFTPSSDDTGKIQVVEIFNNRSWC